MQMLAVSLIGDRFRRYADRRTLAELDAVCFLLRHVADDRLHRGYMKQPEVDIIRDLCRADHQIPYLAATALTLWTFNESTDLVWSHLAELEQTISHRTMSMRLRATERRLAELASQRRAERGERR